MNYPVWDLPFAHGILIAVVAILHVYVSHFAVGGGLYLVVVEHLARRRNDTVLLGTLQRHSRFFMLLTLVFGAISGVGIWFTIGLINPAGTSALIHAFVWGWAIEWCFFLTEIAAAMVYYYGWKRLSPGKHLAMGWIYFATAWMSMVVINGILAFQLTPGAWLETRSFWDGFFNPTYWSSLFARTFYAIAIAGLFALWTASRSSSDEDRQQRPWLVRTSGVWAIVGVALTVVGTMWWWSDVPEAIRNVTRGDMPVATVVTQWSVWLAFGLAALVIIGPLAMPRIVNRPFAVVVLLVGLLVMGAGEWAREGIRKPWVVYDYIYSNGVLASEVEDLRDEGIVANSLWIDPATKADPVAHGEQIFRAACQNCHADDGYNGMAARVKHWDEEFAASMVPLFEYTRRKMPPWVGTDEEAEAVAAYLMTLKPAGVAPPANGQEVYAVRCGPCHAETEDGQRWITDYVAGFTAEDMWDIFDMMDGEYMPVFTAPQNEGEMLATYLEALGNGESVETATRLSDPRLAAAPDAPTAASREEGTR